MSKIFYDHLIGLEEISLKLKGYNLQKEEYDELIGIAGETLHHHVLNIILTHLPKEKHEIFLETFYLAPHDPKLMDFLKNEGLIEIEEKISTGIKKIRTEILNEIARTSHAARRTKKK